MLLAHKSGGGARVAMRGSSGGGFAGARLMGEKAPRLPGSKCSLLKSSRIIPNYPRAKSNLFTMARAPRLPDQPLRRKNGASFSAVMMGRSAAPSTCEVAGRNVGGWVFAEGSFNRVMSALREAMLRERRPLKVLGFKHAKTNLSNMCGHASFVILALAYLETDVLMLRGYAASGIGLSVLFQFYRPQPLWIPIGWNSLFMVINVSMIGLLLKERNDAGKLGDDPEQARVYGEVFQKVDLSPVDFIRLVDLGERREVSEGEFLSKAGRMQEDVFLIVEGTAEVDSEGVSLGELTPEQFIGSMAFQQFISHTNQTANNDSSTPATSSSRSTTKPSPSPLLQRERTRRLSRSKGHVSLTTDLPAQSEANSPAESRASNNGSNTLSAQSATQHGTEQAHQLDDDDEDDLLFDDDYVPGGGGVFEEAKRAGEAALGLLRQDSVVGVVAKSLAAARTGSGGLGGSSQLEPSSTTVTAATDMVVYAWNMHLLKAFIKRHPEAGVALQTAMSADLSRKIEASRGHEDRYRIWLQEALAGGKVTPIEKQKLERYRTAHGIPLTEHKAFLKQFDWKEEEFEAGFQKGVAPRDGSKDFLKYEAMVRRELAKGEIEEEARQYLRQFRARAGIDAQEHLLVLEKQGWTADDYEVGCKGKAAELNGNVQLVQKHRDLKREGEEQERDSRPSLPPVQTASKQLRPTPLEQQQHMRRQMQKQVTSRITMPRSVSSNY